jgi:arginase
MPLAALLGIGPAVLSSLLGWSPKVLPQHTVVVGIRDVDEAERLNIRRAGITVYTMRDIDELGLRAVMEKAIQIAAAGTAGFHVSMDMDWVDPKEAPGVGTPVPGGATYREAHLAMEILADHGGMLSMELVEVNPILDERNRTAELAVQLICSAFGKKIF